MSGTPSPGTSDCKQVVAFGEAARDERGADAAAAGLHVDANAAEAVLDRLDLFDLPLVERLRVDLAADVAREHFGAVDRDDDACARTRASRTDSRAAPSPESTRCSG